VVLCGRGIGGGIILHRGGALDKRLVVSLSVDGFTQGCEIGQAASGRRPGLPRISLRLSGVALLSLSGTQPTPTREAKRQRKMIVEFSATRGRHLAQRSQRRFAIPP
jgi:hypothetical protein